MTADSHLVRLEGTTWSVWREVALRSAGFPADLVLSLCDDELALSADASGPPGARAADDPVYNAAYAAAAGRLSAAMARVAADPAFLEAVTWQNPGLAERLRQRGPRQERRSKDREWELVVASYLQRYCLKNDTIGFFGPVGWARVTPDADGFTVTPGTCLLARRTTYFEVWAIDKVAEAIARQGRQLGWLRPRRTRSAYLAGNVLHRSHGRPVTLTDHELAILRACDGTRTITDVLASAGQGNGRGLLTRLAGLGALRLDLAGPVHAWPERLLRDQLEQITDPAARATALETLDKLIRARDAVAGTAGDPAGLRHALASLADTFESVTGSAASRRAGAAYAARTVIYQDAVRDVRVQVGTAVTGALARPLGLVLDSARWLVSQIAADYLALFISLVDRERARTGRPGIAVPRLLLLASPYLLTGTLRTLTDITAARVADFQQRWQEVLGTPANARRHDVTADAIAARAAAAFPGGPVPWTSARQHSPDIMIAAPSPDAVRQGDFLLVLGELHLAHNTLEGRLFVEQHPDPASLVDAERADHGTGRIAVIPPKDSPVVTSRTSPPSALLAPEQLYWSANLADALDPAEPATVVPAAELIVRRRGQGLTVQRLSSGAELDFHEVIGDIMNRLVGNAFQPVAPAAHQPRITIDRLVLSREQWTMTVDDCGWAFVKDERQRYVQARRWRARHTLPERMFLRVPGEAKPAATDFRSLALVNLFAKMVRQTKAAGFAEFSLSEMLPDLGQLWLPDSAGRRYSSELRMVAVDEMITDSA